MKPIDSFFYLKHNKVLVDTSSLTQLYLPVIGGDAFILYDYLVTFSDEGSTRHQFREILNHLQLGMHRMEEALAILTAIDLLSLYQTKDAYFVKLKAPLSREIFLAQPIYRHLLERHIGEVALSELEVVLPKDARDISKRFSDVFSKEGVPNLTTMPDKNHFDLEMFKRQMSRDGLRFKEEATAVIAIYTLADQHQLNWFDTYQLAKKTAINHVISPSRMAAQLEIAKQKETDGEFDSKETVVLKEAKSKACLEFLQVLKQFKRAKVTKAEQRLLEELAGMDFLDEVINVMVLYTLNKTKSANINKTYIMKIANDFAYQKITTAEAAVVKLRAFTQKNNQTAKPQQTNIPEWTKKDYKREATEEEVAELERLARSMQED